MLAAALSLARLIANPTLGTKSNLYDSSRSRLQAVTQSLDEQWS
jgi:hypothetical protein